MADIFQSEVRDNSLKKGKEENMEFVEVLKSRRSIRAFKTDPVPQSLLRQVIEESVWAPSWANTQPWEFIVVRGAPLKEIVKRFLEKHNERPYPDIARPPEFPEVYLNRIKALAPPGPPPTKDDMQKRQISSLSHYNAPAVIYVMIDSSFFYTTRGTNYWSLYDCGAVSQNICLTAANHGLGTVQQAQAVIYPDILRNVLGTPSSKLFAIGIAIGYPDWDDAVMKGPRTPREALEVNTCFIGN
jgi:nitroreductase